MRGIDCDVVVRKKSGGRVGVLLESSGAERRGEERSKRPEDGSQRAEQRTRHDGASEDDGDESARRWNGLVGASIVHRPCIFRMAMEFYVLLI